MQKGYITNCEFSGSQEQKRGVGHLPSVSTSPSMAKNSVTVPKSVVDDLVELKK